MASHRQIARRRARTAQIVFWAGVGLTAAAVALPLQGALTPRAQTGGEGGREEVAPPPPPEGPHLDQDWVSSVFAGISPDPLPPLDTTPAEPDPVDVAQKPVDDDPAQQATQSTRWEYLGSIKSSRGRSALLRDLQNGNRQHLVKEGKEIDGFTVERVSAEHVILTDAEGSEQVNLAPVTGGWATAKVPPVTAAARAAQAARPDPRAAMSAAEQARALRGKETDPQLVRELREQIISGGLDLEQLNELRMSGEVDSRTADQLIRMYKSSQDLSEEEYAELREKIQN